MNYILYQGESGSGKTEASKRVLQFIAKATHGDKAIQLIKEKLTVANSVLEAFGNAKTRNNDNSSRFGKYMDVQFDPVVSSIIAGILLSSLHRRERVWKVLPNETKKKKLQKVSYSQVCYTRSGQSVL